LGNGGNAHYSCKAGNLRELRYQPGAYTGLPMLHGRSQTLVHREFFFPLLKISLSLFQDLTCPEVQRRLSLGPLQPCPRQTIRSFTLPAWVPWPENGGHPLLSVLQYCPWAGSTWTAVMTNNPSWLSLETLFSLRPQPLLPLSRAVQDEWPPFVLNSSGLPSSASLEKNPLYLFCSLPGPALSFISVCFPLPGFTGTLASHEKVVAWYLMTFLSYSHN
jgi:hypothetical protein